MKAGELDGAFFTAGLGSPLVRALLTDGRFQLVPVARLQVPQFREKVSFYWLDEIPADTYPGQTVSVSTPSLRVLLLTTENERSTA